MRYPNQTMIVIGLIFYLGSAAVYVFTSQLSGLFLLASNIFFVAAYDHVGFVSWRGRRALVTRGKPNRWQWIALPFMPWLYWVLAWVDLPTPAERRQMEIDAVLGDIDRQIRSFNPRDPVL